MPQGTIKTIKKDYCKNMKSYYFKSLSKLILEELSLLSAAWGPMVYCPGDLDPTCEEAGTLNPVTQCFLLCRAGDHLFPSQQTAV